MASKKKKRNSKKKKRNESLNLKVAILMMLSVLSGALIYVKSGYIGETLSPVLGGLVGWIKYAIPFGILSIAIYIACERDNASISKKMIPYIILIISISAMICLVENNINENNQFENTVALAYRQGSQNIGGGALGAILSFPLVQLLGKVGAMIVLIGISVIDLIFIYRIQPADVVKNIVEKRKNREEDDDEYEESEIDRSKKIVKEKAVLAKGEKEPEEEEKDKGLKLFGKKQPDNEFEEEQITITMPNDNALFKKEEEVKKEKSREVLTLEHTITVEDQNYEFPSVEFLNKGKGATRNTKKSLTDTAAKLQRTLYSFGVSAKVENIAVGPTITRYELKPAEGVRVSKIANLSDDIALNLAAESIRIEAPIPGKQAVGIEIPNKEKEVVVLRDIIDTEKFRNYKSKLAFALGKDATGEEVVTDIAKMPHVLIAGSTGSGKSVCINTLITSIIYKSKPNEVKLVMVDPKVVELSVYNGIPHLLIPVVTDPKKAAGALEWAVQEMVKRYHLFAEKNVRDISGYNEALENEGVIEKLPQIVIIIDELADLMMVAAKEVEDAICRLAQMARAAGMHLIIATQRPSVDVITGIIKTNIPSRIAFAVTSQIDSRTILDSAGAEKLLGKGDMLFYPSGASKPSRMQGAFISDNEVKKIVEFLKQNGGPTYNEDIMESIEKSNSSEQEIAASEEDELDPFLMEAIDVAVDMGQISASFIQRRFKVGYARAGRIIDQMEARGLISGYEGSKPRQVLISKERWEELKMGTPTDETSVE